MGVILRDVWRTYGEGPTRVDALQSVDLDVATGEFTVILGPSGSGKTTLLNIIGSIDHATSGHVEVEGLDLTAIDADGRVDFRRSTVGFVFQFFNLIPSLTASENVELVAALSMGDAGDRAHEALSLVGLADRLDHFPSQLSGGEQQRVAIARALVKQPPLLLCDEPTGELDFETGRRILSLLRRLNHDNGQTVILVTHNAAIGAMADRVVRLRSGAVIRDERNDAPVSAESLTW